jgi:hypothetical protein
MMRLSPLPVVLCTLAAAYSADAEQEKVEGMGRTRGWVVATDSGDLAFVDCQGRRSALGSARIESSATRCPVPPPRLDMTGVVRRVDPVRRIVHAEDETGRVRVFHVATDVSWPPDIELGQRIRATGPIDGQVTAITIP